MFKFAPSPPQYANVEVRKILTVTFERGGRLYDTFGFKSQFRNARGHTKRDRKHVNAGRDLCSKFSLIPSARRTCNDLQAAHVGHHICDFLYRQVFFKLAVMLKYQTTIRRGIASVRVISTAVRTGRTGRTRAGNLETCDMLDDFGESEITRRRKSDTNEIGTMRDFTSVAWFGTRDEKSAIDTL
jgi:hypothetical protein